MLSLIVDFHAGCIKSLEANLRMQGHGIHLMSFSKHNFVIEDLLDNKAVRPNLFTKLNINRSLFGNLGFIPKFQTLDRALELRTKRSCRSRYDIVWCCFPPGIYQNLLGSSVAKRVIVVISHRMDLGIRRAMDRQHFWHRVKLDLQSNLVTFVAANKYDAKYFEYYTNVPVPILDIETPYVESSATPPSLPVLIGPSHLNSDNPLVKSVKSALPFLNTIKEHYSSYTYEQLSRHKGFVILPYSIYSISLLELSNLNVPLLVPSDDFLLSSGLLNDVSLFPLYGNKEEIEAFESICTEDEPGPNCDCLRCRKYWLQFAFWKSLNRVFYWNSLDELRIQIDLLNNGQLISNLEFVPVAKIGISDII